MNNTIQITIPTVSEQVREQLIARLSTIDFDGFEEKESELIAFISEEKFDQASFENILSYYKLSYTKSIIQEQNWNALWESNFDPVVIEDFCAIRADFHQPFPDKEHDIIITPKMSFGTGHHATTYMMVSEMGKLDFNNKSVADFGTGTGILAILAEKLGSKHVWAIDIDDWSIENAKENIEKNQCKKVIIEKKDAFLPNEKFDVILANINKNVILENIHGFFLGIDPNALILLSGLMEKDENDVVEAFVARGCTHTRSVERNKWVCLLLEYKLNFNKER